MRTLTLLLAVCLCGGLLGQSTALEIRAVSCPGTFPKPNASIPYEVIIRNVSELQTEPQHIGLFQEYTSTNQSASIPNYGLADVPELAPNQEITLMLDAFFPENWLFPGNQTFSDTWGEFYLSLTEDGAQNDFPVDIYCQIFHSDIAIEIASETATFENDFVIDYTVTVTNNGNETAHNIFADYAKTGNPYGYLGAVGAPSQGRLYYVGTSPYTQRWYIPQLAPGESVSLDVEFKILSRDGAIYASGGSNYDLEVSVTSGHLLDDNLENNLAALSFSPVQTEPELVDLELSLTTLNLLQGQYESQVFFLEVTNNGEADASNIGIDFPFQTRGTLQHGGSDIFYDKGDFNSVTGMWRNVNLAAGESTTLAIELYNLNIGEWTLYAQIVRMDEGDTDSTPNNFRCCEVLEDDEAVLHLNYVPKADLTLSNISIPNALQLGGSTEFSFSLDNIGEADVTDVFSTLFFISENESLDSGDKMLAQVQTRELAVGSLPTVVSLDVPDSFSSGQYHLLIIVDPYGQHDETDESNNHFSFPIEIGSEEENSDEEEEEDNADEEEDENEEDNTASMIDLELQMQTDNPEIEQFATGVFTLNLHNKGDIDATGVVVHMPLLGRASVIGGAVSVSQGELSDASTWRLDLAAGESATYEVHLRNLMYRLELFAQVIDADQNDMDSTPDNAYCCRPDEDDEVAFPYSINSQDEEEDDDNDEGNEDAFNLADLTLSGIEFPNEIPLVEEVRFQLNVDNVGRDSARGEFVIGFYLSEDETLTEEDIYIGHILTGDLEIGQHQATALVSIPGETALGTYQLLAVADVDEQVEEADESNNLFVKTVEIQRQNGVDLELSLSVDNPAMPKYTTNTAVLKLVNAGNEDATSIQVSFPLFAGEVVLVGGTEAEASQGRFNSFTGIWDVRDLEAGGEATLTLQLYPLADGFMPYAQVSVCEEEDIDSTPNNGVCCSVNEDDEAMITDGGEGLFPNVSGQTTTRIQVYPNPATDFIQVQGIYEADHTYHVLDALGKTVQTATISDGEISISHLPSGTYYIDVKTQNHVPIRFVKF